MGNARTKRKRRTARGLGQKRGGAKKNAVGRRKWFRPHTSRKNSMSEKKTGREKRGVWIVREKIDVKGDGKEE